MILQLVIGDRDESYLDKLQSYFEKNYYEEIETVVFSDPDYLEQYLQENPVDVLLVDEEFGDASRFAKDSGFAMLGLSDSVRPDGIRTVLKFKKPSLLYKDVINIYSGRPNADPGSFGQKSGAAESSMRSKVHFFTSFSGGTGTSVVAAAAAACLAKTNTVFYLNLDGLSSGTLFFKGEGSYGFDDILYALKGDAGNLELKLKSSVRRDASGVDFLVPVSQPAYMLELTNEDAAALINALKALDTYDHIVVDYGFRMDSNYRKTFATLDLADTITLVSDGSMTANDKFMRTMQAVEVLDFDHKKSVLRKMALLYNNFSSSASSSKMEKTGMREIGKISPIKHASSVDIMHYVVDNCGRLFRAL